MSGAFKSSTRTRRGGWLSSCMATLNCWPPAQAAGIVAAKASDINVLRRTLEFSIIVFLHLRRRRRRLNVDPLLTIWGRQLALKESRATTVPRGVLRSEKGVTRRVAL